MRLAIILLAVLVASPTLAQERVFRASSIDVEQDGRLDSLEIRVASLEAVPVSQPPAPTIQPVRPKQMTAPSNVAKLATTTKPYAVITIESLPGCPPCEAWKSKEARELRAAGWTVIEAPLTSSRSAPFFRVCIGDKCFSHSGFMSHTALRGIIGRTAQRAKQAVQAVTYHEATSRYSLAELRAQIQAKRPGGWQGPVYADVSPNYVRQHLMEPKHGFSIDQINGLTTSEMLILHDLAPTHGNQIFPTRQRAFR